MATLWNNDLVFWVDFQGVGTGIIEISQQMQTKVNSAGACPALRDILRKTQPHVL